MTAISKEVQALHNEVQELKGLLAQQAKSLSNGHTSLTREDLKNAASKAGANMRKFLHDQQEKMEEARDQARQTIRQRPFATTAAAFAGGLALAALLARK